MLFRSEVCMCVCACELRWKWVVSTWRNVRREIKFISHYVPVPDTTESFILSHLICKLPFEVGVSFHSHFICEETEPQRAVSKTHISCVLWLFKTRQNKIQNKIACLQDPISSFHHFMLPL